MRFCVIPSIDPAQQPKTKSKPFTTIQTRHFDLPTMYAYIYRYISISTARSFRFCSTHMNIMLKRLIESATIILYTNLYSI